MQKSDIEMRTLNTYQKTLETLRDYKDYDASNYWKLAREKENLIKWVEALYKQNSNQPDLTTVLGNTLRFYKKEMTLQDYKEYVQTIMQKSALPRLKYLGIASLGFGVLAMSAGVGLTAALAAPGFIWLGCLGLGLLLLGALSFVMGGHAFMTAQPGMVPLTMEKIAKVAVKTNFISSTTTANTCTL